MATTDDGHDNAPPRQRPVKPRRPHDDPASSTKLVPRSDSGVRSGSVDSATIRGGADYQAATSWLYDRINYEKLASSGARYRFTLDRMRELVQRMGHEARLASESRSVVPASVDSSILECGVTLCQSDPPSAGRPLVVHIAGTKGKGSVSTMVAAMLHGLGHRVGLYTSPHLAHLEERFRVDGQPVLPDQLVRLLEWVRPIVEKMVVSPMGGPSFFELTTALAIEHFHRSECDAVVLETGLGGRLDSTNVFQSDVTAITSIGLDHQHVLGNTLEAIAGEKAGIFKPGIPAISGVWQTPARDVIRAKAAALGISLSELRRDFICIPAKNVPAHWGTSLRVERLIPTVPADRTLSLNLEGQHQADNAAVALAIVHQIRHRLPRMVASDAKNTLSPAALSALESVKLDARLERFAAAGHPIVVLDAAHNPDSIAALLSVVTQRFADHRKVFVFGTSVDKDVAAMLHQLIPVADTLLLTRYHGNPRFVPLDVLARHAISVGAPVDSPPFDDPLRALDAALELARPPKALLSGKPASVVIVCGSFFLAAELRPELLRRYDVIGGPALGSTANRKSV